MRVGDEGEVRRCGGEDGVGCGRDEEVGRGRCRSIVTGSQLVISKYRF